MEPIAGKIEGALCCNLVDWNSHSAPSRVALHPTTAFSTLSSCRIQVEWTLRRFQKSIAAEEAGDYLAVEAELNNLMQVGMAAQAADCEESHT